MVTTRNSAVEVPIDGSAEVSPRGGLSLLFWSFNQPPKSADGSEESPEQHSDIEICTRSNDKRVVSDWGSWGLERPLA